MDVDHSQSVAHIQAQGDVALIHDHLNQRGGAERVLLELAWMWRHAPIYTSIYRPDSTYPEFARFDIRTSPLDRLPVDKGFRSLLPLYPYAFRSFGRIDAELVIACSSGLAHLAQASPRAVLVVYCHTPARWLYSTDYLGPRSRQERLIRPALRSMRRADRAAALRADFYIANSLHVQRRIKEAYGIEAPVVPPPVDVHRFTPRPRGERLLVVSRLLPYRHVDAIVGVATSAGIGLDVVGTGPELQRLRALGGPTVEFHGPIHDDDVTELMENARACFIGGAEDFGIVAVEAQAAGKPVIAFGAGGALETIEDGFSGVYFTDYDPETVLDAVRRCDALETPPELIATRARRFSRAAFRVRLLDVLPQLQGWHAAPEFDTAEVEAQQ